jgi:hypothetical protein
MSNSKKTKEAESRAKMAEDQTKAAQAEAERVRMQAATQAQEQVKITPEAQSVLTGAGEDYKALRGGDVSGVRGIMNFLSGVSKARETASRASPTGSAALAFDVANPNLLAMNQQRIDAESANQQAAGVDMLAKDAERTAVQDITNLSGMDLSAKTGAVNFMFQNAGLAQNNAGLSNQQANTAWDRYAMEKQHRGFWQNLATTAVAGAGQAASAYFGKGK